MEVTQVHVGEEGGVFTLALRGRDDQDALIFQLASTFDDQDALLGMDSYSISSGTGATVYGGISSAEVADTVVSLTLREDAAGSLGVSRVLRFELPDQAATAATAEGLRRIGVVVRSD